MMTFHTLAIPVGYTLVSIVLLWFLIGAKGWWWLKAIFIAATLFFGISLANSLNSYLGWPSQELIPRRFLVHSVLIREPSKKNQENKGVIFIWVTKLPSKLDAKDEEVYDPYVKVLEYRQEGPQPRSYELPYSDGLRRAGNAANKRIAKGAVVIGTRGKDGGFGIPGKGKGKGGKGKGPGLGKDGKGKGKGSAFSFSNSDEIYFHELPPPRVPNKILEQE